ncbi:exocyst complex component SEC3A, partial [Trifolium medium]|nr:exocyst complex component SEC3A [Trifolium medium]
MAKSSADDVELRRACESAIEDPKQKIILSLRVAKSHGILGKSSKLGRQMAKPRVLALSSNRFLFLFMLPISQLLIL